jgi:tetratricopeptide (TPR) repeat protein
MKITRNNNFFAILLMLITLIISPTLVVGAVEESLAGASLSSQPHQAAQWYESAARRLFWRADLQEKAGLAAASSGDMSAALRLLTSASQRGVLSPQARLVMGDALAAEGETEAALQTWESLRDEGAEPAGLFSRLGYAYLERRQFDAAIEALDKASRLDTDDAQSLYWLGLLLATRRPAEALRPLLEASRLDARLEPAVQSLRLGLNTALLQPGKADQLAGAGRALMAVGAYDLAEETFLNATRQDEGNAVTWAWLGAAQDSLGRDGLAQFQEAVKLGPDSAEVFVLLGGHWLKRGNESLALASFKRAAGLEPDNSAWQAAYADALARTGQVPEAAQVYQKAAQDNPHDPAYWRLLAAFCADYSYEVRNIGIPAALKADKLLPDDPQTLIALGRNWDAAGNRDLAAQVWRRALELDPGSAPANLYLGTYYLQENDLEMAFDLLTRASQLDPQGPYGAQAVSILQKYFQ